MDGCGTKKRSSPILVFLDDPPHTVILPDGVAL